MAPPAAAALALRGKRAASASARGPPASPSRSALALLACLLLAAAAAKSRGAGKGSGWRLSRGLWQSCGARRARRPSAPWSPRRRPWLASELACRAQGGERGAWLRARKRERRGALCEAGLGQRAGGRARPCGARRGWRGRGRRSCEALVAAIIASFPRLLSTFSPGGPSQPQSLPWRSARRQPWGSELLARALQLRSRASQLRLRSCDFSQLRGGRGRLRKRVTLRGARKARLPLNSATSSPAEEAPGLSPPASAASFFDKCLTLNRCAAPPGALERRSGALPARAPREGSAPASKALRGQPASNCFSCRLLPGQKALDDSRSDLAWSDRLEQFQDQ